jgi:hypothetical protein
LGDLGWMDNIKMVFREIVHKSREISDQLNNYKLFKDDPAP